jgi:serine/threonine protein kinase
VALTPGTRIGSYEVATLIGEGGMGDVYRATDTNLRRDVAIKVLPDTLSQDSERLARFEREAKMLASLNHPNIAIIYGVERDTDDLVRSRRVPKLPLGLSYFHRWSELTTSYRRWR